MWTRQSPGSQMAGRIRHGPVILVGLCLLCSLLTNCGSTEPPTSRSTTIRIGAGLGTGFIKSTGTGVLRDLLYTEPLVSFSWSGRPVPRLATFEWNDDNTTLRLKLVRGVRLHDGRPLLAPLVTDVLRAAVQRAHDT